MRTPRTVIAATMAAAIGCLTFSGTAVAAPSPTTAVEAARSVRVTIINYSPYTLDRRDYSAAHGIWTLTPPEHIAPLTGGAWATESNGILTGTEGTATFSTAAGPVSIWWNNPYLGSNSYSCVVPAGFTCGNNGSSNATNANTTFMLLPRLQG